MSDCVALDDLEQLVNTKSRWIAKVEYIEASHIEAKARAVLARISYSGGKVSLEQICNEEMKSIGLKIVQHDKNTGSELGEQVLGKIGFDPLEIHLYGQPIHHKGRERFTLAHELGHHFLGHSKYMTGESFRTVDLSEQLSQNIGLSDIRRMEWQANYFAACLLLPRNNLRLNFFNQLAICGIADKGYGYLYVDEQLVNLENFVRITDYLKTGYEVSRTVVTRRLVELGLLKDVRGGKQVRDIASILTWED